MTILTIDNLLRMLFYCGLTRAYLAIYYEIFTIFQVEFKPFQLVMLAAVSTSTTFIILR
jgi:hypothetical protein